MTHLYRPGLVRAEGARLVDDAGPLLLRGVGLGNWLLPEGYMWKFGDEQASPRQIERRIEQLVGPAHATEFWRRFADTFITQDDFALIARLGFDHVRLPINARGLIDDAGHLREPGFELVERAVAWSEQSGLRILLDLHGAPGGQTGTNIDDSPHGKPELFMFADHRRHTITLWRELAARYADRDAVLGYDLLNEPLPGKWQHRYADDLVDLYRQLTSAIREVDERHLIMYEGSHWATNPDPVSTRFDDNEAVQFHRYWCPPDETSIEAFLRLRDELDVPIYMGEGGENTPAWVFAATRLYERHDIGWNFWPWKKLDTMTSPMSAPLPRGWDDVADPARTPSPGQARRVLDEFLDAVVVSNCDLRTEIVDALFGRTVRHLPGWAGVRDAAETAIEDLLDGVVPDGFWNNPDQPRQVVCEAAAVPLMAGQQLGFALSDEPREIRVHAEPADAVTARWDAGNLTLHAVDRVRVQGVEVAV